MGNTKSNAFKQAFFIGFLTFFLAIFMAFTSDLFLKKSSSLIISFLFLILIILIGIVFDMIGTASTAASIQPFNAKASKKLKGAKEALMLVRNADRVASFCNDVVGDICGTVSGALGAAIVFQIMIGSPSFSEIILSMLMTGFVAATTVGGKAFGKRMALEKSEAIIYQVGLILASINELFNGKKVKDKNVAKKREKVRKS